MIQKTITLGNDKSVTLTFNKYAPQTNGAVMATQGNCMVLSTVVSGREDNSKDYFPLSVDFIHKLYAGAQIKGGKWSKRDVGGSDADILESRIIDRSIRPLFPSNFKSETQVIATLMSSDPEVDHVVLSFLSTAVALAISDIPFNGPVSAVRIARTSDKTLIANPSISELKNSDLDLLVCTGPWGVNMIEADGKVIDNQTMYEAIALAVSTSESINDQISKIAKELGKPKMVLPEVDPKLSKVLEKKLKNEIAIFLEGGQDGAHNHAEEKFVTSAKETLATEITDGTYTENQVVAAALEILEASFKEKMMTGWRYDGRKIDEIRPLSIETGILPGAHGSAFFQRGLTQAITNVSLSTLEEKLYTQNSLGEDSKTYMHFYSAMPFSTGQPGRTGRPGRREIGHGALAEKALWAVLPTSDQFPYTVVLTSEILSQNGSSSMASTCGSTMALMDAGVPISAHVAGISTGMVSTSDDKFVLLTDIAGIEDHFGDMDFKITGTRQGITAIQLDIKRAGLTLEMIKQTLSRSEQARFQILDLMEKTLSTPRPTLADHAPKISIVQLPQDKIGEVIGSGGKTIKMLMERYGVQIDINDEGQAFVSGLDASMVETCIEAIKAMIKEPQIGETYQGEVARVESYGAFVEFLPGQEALLHVSEMATGFIKDVNSIIKVGDKLEVTISGFNDNHQIKLSAPKFKAAHVGQASSAPQQQLRTERKFVGERHASAPSFGNFHPPAPGARRPPAPNRASFNNSKKV